MKHFFKSIAKKRKERQEKKNILKEFMHDHESTLPRFSPHGQRLEWNISVHKTGEYDIYTGEQSGTYKVFVSQKCPAPAMYDDIVYKYNINTKKLEATHALWR